LQQSLGRPFGIDPLNEGLPRRLRRPNSKSDEMETGMTRTAKTIKPPVKRPSLRRRPFAEELQILWEIQQQEPIWHGGRVKDEALANQAMWDAIGNSWLGRGLKRCVKENCPFALRQLVLNMLDRIGAGTALDPVLERVFQHGFYGKDVGRPVSVDRDTIVRIWIELGRPRLTRNTLARAVYGTEFDNADLARKKILRDRCRRKVERALPADQIAKATSAAKVD
jgi:hypothetical protein